MGPFARSNGANCFCAKSCPFWRAAVSANKCCDDKWCGTVAVVVLVGVPENGLTLKVKEVPTVLPWGSDGVTVCEVKFGKMGNCGTLCVLLVVAVLWLSVLCGLVSTV